MFKTKSDGEVVESEQGSSHKRPCMSCQEFKTLSYRQYMIIKQESNMAISGFRSVILAIMWGMDTRVINQKFNQEAVAIVQVSDDELSPNSRCRARREETDFKNQGNKKSRSQRQIAEEVRMTPGV